MSTKYNRIKVADLEKNERDKILSTNDNGELEFKDIESVKTQNYNALDYNVEGKALDARQGKVLKDLVDSKQSTLVAGTNITISGNTISSTGGVASDASITSKGIIQLNGDLGGTAALPTTPTAIHITGDENFTGTKTSLITGSGNGIVSNVTTGTGLNFVGQNNGVNTFTVNKIGMINAVSANLSGEVASTLVSFDSSKNLKSLPLANNPSLTEITYVKGVTSAIQTQLNAKLSGSGTANKLVKYSASTTTTASSITDTGSLVTIANPTVIDSKLAGKSGLKFANMTSSVGTSTIFATGIGTSVYDAVIDSLGNIFTCHFNANNNVYKTTPNGVVSLFATVGSQPSSIAIDANDNLYTTNVTGANISKITPAGVVTSLSLAGGVWPARIVFDSIGNLFVANRDTNNITKITPSGTSSIFASGLDWNPSSIAIDSFDNLYTNSYGLGKITKITPNGVVTTGWGTTDGNPYRILIDSSNNVYTLNDVSNNITKITPNGIATKAWSTIGSASTGFTFDNKGNIFVVTFTNNNVYKVNSSGVSTFYGTLGTGTGGNGIVFNKTNNNIYTINFNTNNISLILPSLNRNILGLDASGNIITDANINTLTDGTVLLPNLSIEEISANPKAPVTKEYLDIKLGDNPPSSSTELGETGQIRVHGGYIYFWVGPNEIVRVAGTTF